jgi:hypothetical protein
MIAAQLSPMSDPLRTDGSRAHADVASGSDRDAKIEQLLLIGLDHYFAARYELAINVWTRALFLDRSHARARAYIDRARSALAERQRESEELLQNGVAAYQRGEADEARRLLQSAIEGGAPSDEALALLDRWTGSGGVAQPSRAAPGRAPRARSARPWTAPRAATVGSPPGDPRRRDAGTTGAARGGLIDWRSMCARQMAVIGTGAGGVSAPVAREASLPLPRQGEPLLRRA